MSIRCLAFYCERWLTSFQIRRATQGDFAALKEAGVELEGKIALTSYGGGYRGIKVKNAQASSQLFTKHNERCLTETQENGMAGCIIFTDPGDDGEVTVKNGYLAYPGRFFHSRYLEFSG